jgi:hypothetical protein
MTDPRSMSELGQNPPSEPCPQRVGLSPDSGHIAAPRQMPESGQQRTPESARIGPFGRP